MVGILVGTLGVGRFLHSCIELLLLLRVLNNAYYLLLGTLKKIDLTC